jgi:hypothetical protein
MNEEIIVAVYDTEAHADAAVRDLEAAHVPPTAITRHAGGPAASGHPVPAATRLGKAFGVACSEASRTTTPPSTTAVLKAARRW